MVEKLSLSEVFALFGRSPEQTRSVGSVDSEEYLTLVSYLVSRSQQWYQGIV